MAVMASQNCEPKLHHRSVPAFVADEHLEEVERGGEALVHVRHNLGLLRVAEQHQRPKAEPFI